MKLCRGDMDMHVLKKVFILELTLCYSNVNSICMLLFSLQDAGILLLHFV